MNILATITAYPPSTGGAQVHQHRLLQQLQVRQHEVQVVSAWNTQRTDWLLGTTLRMPKQPYAYTIDDINVYRVGLSFWEKLSLMPHVLTYYPTMQRAIPAIAACFARYLYPYCEHADLIHNVRMGREGLSYASLYAARRRDIPFVFTPLHHPRWVGWRYRAYLELYQAADVVLALTNAEKHVLMKLGVCEDQITVTGIGPVLSDQDDPGAFMQEYSIDGPFVLFLGQHYQYKGYRPLLHAAPLVWKRFPETHFVFIGPAVGQSERDFARLADRRVHRLGSVDLQTKTNALAACTLLCVPSTQESFGGVYTEAWHFGKPVIGCNIPAVAEVINDGIDGFLVPQEPASIAERICAILQSPTQAHTLGAAGQQKAAAQYTWERIAERTEQAYRYALRTTSTKRNIAW